VSEPILLERRGATALLTLNRPDVLNALDRATLEALAAHAATLASDATLRAVVVTGSGRAFAAGADIAAMRQMGPVEGEAFSRLGHTAMAALEALAVPTIAAVNGFALGGGCELALACDFIYAARGAKLGQPEVTLGVIPGFGGTQRLIRRVGIAKAKEMVFTGDMVDADEALRIGLADLVVERAELLGRARQTAEKIATKAPLAIAEAKRVMLHGQSLPLPDACALEANAFASLFDTSDQREGMKAFVQKRPAVFEGK
jgi:enoyl-CoA hydratase